MHLNTTPPSPNDIETEPSSPGLQPSLSNNSILTDNPTDSPIQRRTYNKSAQIRKYRNTKTESTYVKNYRLSRYKYGMHAAMPFRRTDVSLEELPIDNVGCFSNATFSWIRKFRKTKDESISQTTEPLYHKKQYNYNTLPKSTYTDSCRVNAKRILGLYKYEEQTHGQQKGSMFRVAWQFCRTRLLIANLLHILSIVIGLLGIVIFLNKSMIAMDNQRQLLQISTNQSSTQYTFLHGQLVAYFYDPSLKIVTHNISSTSTSKLTTGTTKMMTVKLSTPEPSTKVQSTNTTVHKGQTNQSTTATPTLYFEMYNNRTTELPSSPTSTPHKNIVKRSATMDFNHQTQHQLQNDIEYQMFNKLLYSFGLPGCYFGMVFIKSVSNWINLRTASRLRTACISSVFSKSMKSSVIYQIAPHQIMSLVLDEGEIIYSLILKGNEILGTITGIVLYLIGSIILLGAPGIWTACGLILLILAAIPLAFISNYFYRNSLLYAATKMTIIEELLCEFKNIVYLNLQRHFQKLFSINLSNQYKSMLRSEIFSTRFYGGITAATILGGLYLIWCDANIKTDSIPVLILIIIYTHFIQQFSIEFSESFVYIFKGRSVLDKIKKAFLLTAPQVSKTKPKLNLQISISQAVFEWQQQQILTDDRMKNDNAFELLNRRKQFSIEVDEFFITKEQIIGITGPSGCGKTSLLYAIMGHMRLMKGKINLKGKFCFFPSTSHTRIGTIKENITYGTGVYDPNKYLDALYYSSLIENVSDQCHSVETGNYTIKSIKSSLCKLQKIDLARAMYCDREIIIMDEPLSSIDNCEEASEIFLNTVQYLIASKKTVIVATQSDYILKHCNRIYVVDDGYVSNNKEYEDLRKLASYKHMVEKYYQMQSSKRDCTQNILPNYDEILSDPLPNNVISNQNGNIKPDEQTSNVMSIFCIIKLIILYFTNIFIYLIMPFVFIGAVSIEYIEPWLALFSLAAILLILFIEILSRNVIFREASNTCKSFQKKLFAKYSQTTINFLDMHLTSDLIQYFQNDNFKFFHLNASIIQYIITITLIMGFQIYASFWNTFVMCLPIGGAIGLFYYYRFSANYYYECEQESKNSMQRTLINNLRNRAALQSYEEEYRSEFYELIEKNATALIMRKSIVFHSQFLSEMIQVFCFIPFCQTLLLIPFTSVSVYHYVFGVFLYLVLCNNLNRLLETLFEKEVINRKNDLIDKFVMTIPSHETGHELDGPHKEIIPLEITFKSIVVNKLNNRHLLTPSYSSTTTTTRTRITSSSALSSEATTSTALTGSNNCLKIQNLYIKKSENIGIKGYGSKYITPILLRLLIPNGGTIFLGNRDLMNLSRTYLTQNIGVISKNPYVFNGTIRNVLDPDHKLEQHEITSALKRFYLWESVVSLQNGIDDKMMKLDRKCRQLLCLAVCWRRLPSIVIVENPHPEIQKLVDEIIHAYFVESTVIVIGTQNSQFKQCHRVIEL